LSIYKTFAYLPNSNFEDLDKGYGNNNIGTIVESVKYQHAAIRIHDRTNEFISTMSTSTDLDTNVTKEPVYATYPNFMDVHTV
jgi:hypothetical protein